MAKSWHAGFQLIKKLGNGFRQRENWRLFIPQPGEDSKRPQLILIAISYWMTPPFSERLVRTIDEHAIGAVIFKIEGFVFNRNQRMLAGEVSGRVWQAPDTLVAAAN